MVLVRMTVMATVDPQLAKPLVQPHNNAAGLKRADKTIRGLMMLKTAKNMFPATIPKVSYSQPNKSFPTVRAVELMEETVEAKVAS